MAIGAADPVNVVGAFSVGEGCVHGLHVDSAMGHLRMAGLAGRCGIFIVTGVTGETADSLVNADGRAVVAGADLRAVMIRGCNAVCFRLTRRVALVTECLALIGTDPHRACAFRQLRKREKSHRKVHLLAAVIKGQ